MPPDLCLRALQRALAGSLRGPTWAVTPPGMGAAGRPGLAGGATARRGGWGAGRARRGYSGGGGGGGAEPSTESLTGDQDRTRQLLLKVCSLFTVGVVSVNVIPYLGEPLIANTIQLAQVEKDFFQNAGVWRLDKFAIHSADKLVEHGAVGVLVDVLERTDNLDTRRLCLTTLRKISATKRGFDAVNPHTERLLALAGDPKNASLADAFRGVREVCSSCG